MIAQQNRSPDLDGIGNAVAGTAGKRKRKKVLYKKGLSFRCGKLGHHKENGWSSNKQGSSDKDG